MSQKVKDGSKVTVHYIGKLTDGNVFDNSYTRNTPLTFEVGSNQIIPGFESAILNRTIDEKFKVIIPKDQAYGEYSEDNIKPIPKKQLNSEEELPIGAQVQGTTPEGHSFICTIKEYVGDDALLDMNHPLAGKDLEFEIEILGIEE